MSLLRCKPCAADCACAAPGLPPTPTQPPPHLTSSPAEAFWLELNSRLQRLEAVTEEARQANIGVAKAKRVLKELQAQVGCPGRR